MQNDTRITKKEIHTIFIVSIVFALRMLGVFMILPTFSVDATYLRGSNEHLIGIAIGIYGITQMIFQLPFGFISDKIGRKPVIIIGLIISIIGNVLAAISNNIWGLIIGRALQGSGAIGSVLIALLLDSVRERYQSHAMAIIGITFGVTFIISMILGPFISGKFGLHGIFQIITIATIIALVLFVLNIDASYSNKLDSNTSLKHISNNIKLIIINSKLLKLIFNNFCLHTMLILNFIAWPRILISLGYPKSEHFKIYAIIILISMLILLPYFLFSKIAGNYKQKTLSISINILFISELIMFILNQNKWLFLFGMQLFFVAFNLIESILPTLIKKQAPEKYTGTVISIYSIGQFLGISIGGIIGGLLLSIQGIQLVLIYALLTALINIKIK